MFTFICCKQLLNWIWGFIHLEKFCILILGFSARNITQRWSNYPEHAQPSCLILYTENKF